jgi:decaprenyl-phosphate phosphoribosyltransferase
MKIHFYFNNVRNFIKAFLKIARPEQWIKNLIIFAPLIFSLKLNDFNLLLECIYIFAIFCLASSSAYIFNDIKDVKDDQKHSEKRKYRPLVTGEITIFQAYFALFLLYAFLAFFLYKMPEFSGLIIIYILINLFYSHILKNIVIIDLFIIASGFVIRLYAGGVAIEVPISSWMFITTLSVSLFLASSKRLKELKHNGKSSRKILGKYSDEFLNDIVLIAATSTLFFYSMFIVTNRPNLAITLPIVIFGIFRYLYLTKNNKFIFDSPTDVLLKDKQLILTVIFWLISIIYLIY